MIVISEKSKISPKDLKGFLIINDYFLLEKSDQKFFAIKDGSKVVACITYSTGLASYSHNVASIFRLEVIDSYRKRGLGGFLLKLAATDIFSNSQIEAIVLKAATSAIKFYKKFGFKMKDKKMITMELKRETFNNRFPHITKQI